MIDKTRNINDKKIALLLKKSHLYYTFLFTCSGNGIIRKRYLSENLITYCYYLALRYLDFWHTYCNSKTRACCKIGRSLKIEGKKGMENSEILSYAILV